MYYRLHVDLVHMNTRIDEITNIWHSLSSGQPLAEEELELPYRCSMTLDEELLDGSEPEASDDEQEFEHPLIYSFYPSSCVMKKEMVEMLLDAGVDNLQVFPAVVRCDALHTIFEDYVVVNIIGLVACAAQDHSRSSSLADLQFFHELVLDERQVRGLRIFRLAESQIDIIVDESIAAMLRAGPFVGLELEKLKTSGDR